MLQFLRYLLSYTVRFAILLAALLALAFAMETMDSGIDAARSAEFVARVWQAGLSCLFAIVPAIVLFAIHRTMKERRKTQ